MGIILSKDETNLLQSWDDNRKHISIGQMLFGQGRFDQAGFASSMKLKTPLPGMKYNYSTGETNILSQIIKTRLEVQGIDYLDFIKGNLVEKNRYKKFYLRI